MPIYVQHNNTSKIELPILPDGGVKQASKNTMSNLLNHINSRNFIRSYPHLKNLLFDPQVYAANLDAVVNYDVCKNMATYPWFGINVQELEQLDDDTFIRYVHENWQRQPLNSPVLIREAVQYCINYQIELGCEGIILPSPLITNVGTDFEIENIWLQEGIRYCEYLNCDQPIYTTLAISDYCLRVFEPLDNPLIHLVTDVISSSRINGVYLLIDQASEENNARFISNERSLRSALTLTYLFSIDINFRVIVNYFGPFGLVLRAAGADTWITNWYKSLIRFRTSDQQSGGRSYPSFWSPQSAVEVHLDHDFDNIIHHGLINLVDYSTNASSSLLRATRNGQNVNTVPQWQYRQSNSGASIKHFQQAVIQQERELNSFPIQNRLNFISSWLEGAVQNVETLSRILGPDIPTKRNHVHAWNNAFSTFRRDQNI